jgi:predicted molibdopterin-dependent oxidoreductase YjgC
MGLKEPRTLTMDIDHRRVSFPEGAMVHRVAALNGIDIPSLCSHKDLSPFGGCRLCMVEIEGMRGYPLSCSTAAQEGMVVLTDTVRIRELRQEILKLILSEHPSSCLVCEEKVECRDYQGTIRKAGVTTGCRYCPNDGQCELQDLVEKIGVADIDYPIYYHGYEPEHDDPFYDRDYNVCILCGRCVRMCQEVRGSSILAFTHRGPKVKIGPAFGRSHADAGCEFCGACVDVCPTGALADKASKWDGRPDGRFVSTCPFCAIGCQIELEHKSGRFSKARANLDPEVNDGQLCVRGRFCMPEATHHFERARKPMLRKGDYFREVSWEEALEKVANVLRNTPPEDFALRASADLTTESLFAAQKFVRDVLGSESIDSTGREQLAGGPGLWSRLFSLPISIKDIATADAVLVLGLDSRFDFSVVGTKVRTALDRGARLVTIDPREGNLARAASLWLRPRPGREGRLLEFLGEALAGRAADAAAAARDAAVDAADLARALDVLASSRDLTMIVGPQIFAYDDREALARGLMTLASRPAVNIVPLYFGANARGALEMGVFPGLGPGGIARRSRTSGDAPADLGARRPKVLYLAGDIPFTDRPECDFLIVQDIYLPPFEIDAFLPAASFAEGEGTLINIEGRVQELVQVEAPPEGAVTGFMRPDWRIFSDLARAMKSDALPYATVRDVIEDIRRAVPGFPAGPDRKPRRMAPIEGLESPPFALEDEGEGNFRLVVAPGGYRHRGIDLSSKVGGLGDLGLEEGIRMNPADLESLGLKNGDRIELIFDHGSPRVPGNVRSDAECAPGIVACARPVLFGGSDRRREPEALFRLRGNPVRVRVARVSS